MFAKQYIKFLLLIFYLYFCRHVQVNNEGAIEFYKKFGFEIVETKEHYYKRIEPADAHVLQKNLRSNSLPAAPTAIVCNGQAEKRDKKAA